MKLPRPELKRARIEIIPMIDTIFFLLVFFMIASLSMVQMSARKVILPLSATAGARPLEKVVVSLSRDGQYSVDRRAVRFEQIASLLGARLKDNPSSVVVINCDRHQSVGKFTQLMRVVGQTNPASLLIAAAPKAAARP